MLFRSKRDKHSSGKYIFQIRQCLPFRSKTKRSRLNNVSSENLFILRLLSIDIAGLWALLHCLSITQEPLEMNFCILELVSLNFYNFDMYLLSQFTRSINEISISFWRFLFHKILTNKAWAVWIPRSKRSYDCTTIRPFEMPDRRDFLKNSSRNFDRS